MSIYKIYGGSTDINAISLTYIINKSNLMDVKDLKKTIRNLKEVRRKDSGMDYPNSVLKSIAILTQFVKSAEQYENILL